MVNGVGDVGVWCLVCCVVCVTYMCGCVQCLVRGVWCVVCCGCVFFAFWCVSVVCVSDVYVWVCVKGMRRYTHIDSYPHSPTYLPHQYTPINPTHIHITDTTHICV